MEFNRFDVTTKELVWDGPAAWLERFGIGPPGPVEVIDSDITALTAAADKVIKVGGPEPYLVNIELQSSHDKELVETTWFRQAALYHRHKLPVLTRARPVAARDELAQLYRHFRNPHAGRLADESVQLPGGEDVGRRSRALPDIRRSTWCRWRR